jgi:MFS family permease
MPSLPSVTTIDDAAPVTARRWSALAVVASAQFMFVVDAFVVNVALPTIRADLHAGSGAMTAVIAVYQLAYAATVITGGRLGDLIGRKRVFVLGVLAFTAASVWCAASRSGAELVMARLAQGGAAALMVPQVLATIHVLFPAEGRGRAFMAYGVALGLGGAVGFALGGALVTLDPAGLGWRSVFLVNLPVGLAIAAAAIRLMPELPPRGDAKLDLLGAGLLFVALLMLIAPLLAGRELGWPSWLWTIMVGGAGLLRVFLAIERWVARRGGSPLVELALLRDRGFMRGLATVFAFQSGNISFYLLITLFMQGVMEFSPLRSGTAVVPLAVAFTCASQLSGRRAGREIAVTTLKSSSHCLSLRGS